jgi:hypothetical protein
MKPKKLTSKNMRQIARNIRNAQWGMMEKMQKFDTIWFCVWNKRRLPEAPDEIRCGLIDGMELLSWTDTHSDWFEKGEWNDERYAMPIKLTDAGRDALNNRALYDMEPVHGGLVEPGFIVIPLPISTAS